MTIALTKKPPCNSLHLSPSQLVLPKESITSPCNYAAVPPHLSSQQDCSHVTACRPPTPDCTQPLTCDRVKSKLSIKLHGGKLCIGCSFNSLKPHFTLWQSHRCWREKSTVIMERPVESKCIHRYRKRGYVVREFCHFLPGVGHSERKALVREHIPHLPTWSSLLHSHVQIQQASLTVPLPATWTHSLSCSKPHFCSQVLRRP